jgi:hypothetical protein
VASGQTNPRLGRPLIVDGPPEDAGNRQQEGGGDRLVREDGIGEEMSRGGAQRADISIRGEDLMGDIMHWLL